MTSNMYPSNILGLMFRVLDSVMGFCNQLVQNLELTPLEAINAQLENSGLPGWLATEIRLAVQFLAEAPTAAFLRNMTVFDLIIGTGIAFILVFGMIKFFTSIVTG